jgi:hypothetical protein
MVVIISKNNYSPSIFYIPKVGKGTTNSLFGYIYFPKVSISFIYELTSIGVTFL